MKSKTTLIVAQIFISCIMSFLMTGVFSALPYGLAPGWFARWMLHFVSAWPVAFIFANFVGPTGFFLAGRVLKLAEAVRPVASLPEAD